MNAFPTVSAGLKPRLLIVDDVAENREILTRRFQRRGFETVEADGGAKAVELVEQQTFDVVLLDIQMPDIDGLEVLRRIRERHSPDELPVIMVTGRAQQADVKAAVTAAANDYITKPVDFEVALARVEALLARRAQTVGAAPSDVVFFTFPEASHSLPPHPMCGIAPEKLVLQLLSAEQLAERLGGCVRYVDDAGQAYLGVWGERNVERFHSALSSRHPRLVVRREKPSTARLDWRRNA